MTDWLRARSRATPHKLAVLQDGRAVSYAELDRLADGFAAGLLIRCVQPGDRVAMRLPSSIDAVALIHAVARVGAVLVPLNTRLTDGELAFQIGLTQPVLIVDGGRLTTDDGRTTCVTLAELAQSTNQPINQFPNQPIASPQSIIFTSGTTGQPKGTVLTFDNHLQSANASAYRIGIDVNDRWLSCLPLYHVGGLAVVFRSCLYGTAIVLHQRFAVEAFNESLERDSVTLTSLVPTMLHRLLQSRTAPWPESLRLILLGGAAATPELLAAAWDAGVPVATTYGLTEASSQVATALPADAQRKPGTVGKPLFGTDVRIVDESGDDLPVGEIGEVLVRGPQVMAGYYCNPEATARTIRQGWLHTGDLGYVDDEGDLFLVQRRSDLIVTGGENVYPAEVEAVLRAHPAVAEACVVAVPDAEWGQRVAAAVQLRPDGVVDETALLAFCRARLAGYKVPRQVRFVEELPQTASGKIERRRVAEMLG
ncbi:MAG: o-succinylbenzoate--CoA ligase [Caldilineaceae bacterium]|nr:o-succinylbenzoate--CoA ligase [Caldilineaceae bacterium]